MEFVLRIDVDGALVVLPWPDDEVARGAQVRGAVGGPADRAVYHRQAHLHVHGNGAAEGLPVNLAAWVLASQWRGVEIPYGFYGPVLVTGPERSALGDGVAGEVRAVCAAVAEVRQEWVTRPPAGEGPARAEMLAAARHSVAALA
ncbi:hypothetical protein [Streptomyces lavendulae]|uniref:hypothetical protein n=1 Tax=Streptomyces lavendulae TaxID=1914 RepID=UPI0024A0CC4E|nr:hypothetical protein [Streptomyces lavendulae]GLW03674.1 hypothetical protein Slala05_73040 [Streptomyces lavendulae subsp. lavendulae]